MSVTAVVMESDPSALRLVSDALKEAKVTATMVQELPELVTAVEAYPSVVVLAAEKPPAVESSTIARALAYQAKQASIVLMSRVPMTTSRLFELTRQGIVDVIPRPCDKERITDAVLRGARIVQSRQRFAATWKAALHAAPADGYMGQLPPALVKAMGDLDAGEMTIPAVPAIMQEMRAALADPKKSISDMSRIIEKDQSLSANVLRVANTTEFARGGRVTDLLTAVSRIGLKRVAGFVETILLRNCFQPHNPALKRTTTEIWRYSVALACAMRALSERVAPGQVEPHAAYAAGLLCDVGAALIIWVVDGATPDLAEDQWLPLVRDRHETLGTRVITEWGLAPVLVQLAGNHHAVNRPAGVSAYWPLAAIAMELADSVLNTEDLTRRLPRSVVSVARCADSLHLDVPMVKASEDQVRRELEAILSALG